MAAPPAMILCLVASHQAWCLNDYVPHESDFAASFGMGFALVSLAAFWAAWGPLRIFTRSVLSVLLTVLAGLAMASFVFIKGPRDNQVVISLMIGIACGAQWLGMALFLAVLSMFLRIRVDLPCHEGSSSRQAAQFSLRHVLVWITAIAITLAVARWLVAAWAPAGFDLRAWRRFAALFCVISSFHVVVAFLCVWSFLGQTWLWVKLPAALMSIVLVTGLEYGVMELVIGGMGSGDHLFIWLNGSSFLCFAINLLIVRCSGYRIVVDFKRLPLRELMA
jgi:hypothetical protein